MIVTSSDRPGKRRVARKYAAGVPTTISAIEIAFVFSVTRNASRATSLQAVDRLRNRTSQKIATIGRARKTTLIATASKSSARKPCLPAARACSLEAEARLLEQRAGALAREDPAHPRARPP